MWTVWAVTRAPARQDSLENTVKGISMNACLGPATPLAASTVCSWSTITCAAVASDTRVQGFEQNSVHCFCNVDVNKHAKYYNYNFFLFPCCLFFALSSGRHCESMVDLCLSKPCHNSGVCSMNMSSVHGYTCSCVPVSFLMTKQSFWLG